MNPRMIRGYSRFMILDRLEAILKDPHANKKDLSISGYILDHKDEVVHMSVRDIANAAGVSPGSIMRFAQKFGLKGYADFRSALSAEIASYESLDRNQINSAEFTAQFFLSEMIHQMKHFNNYIDFENFYQAILYLKDSKSIAVFANELDQDILAPFRSRLLSMGYSVNAERISSNQIHLANTLGENDFAFIVENGERSDWLNKVEDVLIERNVPFFKVSSNKKEWFISPLKFVQKLPKFSKYIFYEFFITYLFDLIIILLEDN